MSADASTIANLYPAMPLEVHHKRFIASGRMHGSHYLALKQPSKLPEFSRPYVQGDPLNFIDWKAYARTDHMIIRETRDEATARVMIFLEIGPSMEWPDQSALDIGKDFTTFRGQKLELALRVALHIAHLHGRLGDFVSLWFFLDDNGDSSKPETLDTGIKIKSPADLVAIFQRLEHAGFSREALLKELSPIEFIKNRVHVAYWIGDGLSTNPFDDYLQLADRAAFIHTLSDLELDISWIDKSIAYFDNSIAKKEYLGQTLTHKSSYLRQFGKWQNRLRKILKGLSGHYFHASESCTIQNLQRFLVDLAAKR
jgi:hypothetical protein